MFHRAGGSRLNVPSCRQLGWFFGDAFTIEAYLSRRRSYRAGRGCPYGTEHCAAGGAVCPGLTGAGVAMVVGLIVLTSTIGIVNPLLIQAVFNKALFVRAAPSSTC